MARKKNNYINNKTLYGSMIHHKSEVDASKRDNKEEPRVSNYIGESILLICNNLAKKPNFSGYSYKQEMISDAITDCIGAVNKFDPERTNNPFAYFTQIAWNAFIRRIQKEKRENYTKHKNMINFMTESDIVEPNVLKNNDMTNNVISDFENKLNSKKSKEKKTRKQCIGLEVFQEN